MLNLPHSSVTMKRRDFLASVAATGLVMSLPGGAQAEEPAKKPSQDGLNVGIIGFGAEGAILLDSCKNIPGLQFKAVCDIRYEERAVYAKKLLRRFGHVANAYEDYKEMLATEKLDAVIVASPDWMHAEHTNACLRAGKHVYCEKEMANTLEKARSMVQTARETKMLLQIGHQRRSNPRYRHAIDTLMRENKLLGRVTKSSAQWNRSVAPFLVSPPKFELEQSKIEKWGYSSMTELLNWRWFRKYGGGPMVDLGSHQIDLFIWLYGCAPSAIIATGGNDFYADREWYDNVTALYEFKTPEGIARANYNVFTTTQHGGFYETFMGTDGTIVISEVVNRGNIAEREPTAPSWDAMIEKGYIKAPPLALKPATSKDVVIDTRVSQPAGSYQLGVELNKYAHTPHLENFFSAIRDGVPLNCPPELAYESAVAVLKANEAVAAGRRLEFSPEEFKV